MTGLPWLHGCHCAHLASPCSPALVSIGLAVVQGHKPANVRVGWPHLSVQPWLQGPYAEPKIWHCHS